MKIGGVRKVLNDLGILPDSKRYYHDADEFMAQSLFYVSRAGQYHCTSEYRFERRSSGVETCQAMYVEEGQLLLSYGEEEVAVGPDEMALIHLGTPHHYRTGGDELKMKWFHIDGRGSRAYVRQIHSLRGILMDRETSRDSKKLVNRVFQFLDERYEDPQAISICVHRILAMLNRPREGAGGIIFGRMNGRQDTGMEASLTYIREHFSEAGLSVEELADLANLSTWYYIKRFRIFSGTTPHKYILRLRIEAARELLDTTSMSVEEIAYQCGFSGSSHFIEVFRKNSGMTPMNFRNLWR